MREIKFRAWDDEDKTMYSQEDLDKSLMSILSDPWYKIMQYTGLKDKEGKEIYEGDIIQYRHGNYRHTERFVVDYDPEFGYPGLLLESLYACKVVGNIYENKELLKGGVENE
jgi:hypothetical protein